MQPLAGVGVAAQCDDRQAVLAGLDADGVAVALVGGRVQWHPVQDDGVHPVRDEVDMGLAPGAGE